MILFKGEHSSLILRELGFSNEQIQKMKEEKVIECEKMNSKLWKLSETYSINNDKKY